MAGSSANVNDFLLGRDNGEGHSFLRAPAAASRAVVDETAAAAHREPVSNWAAPALALLGALGLGGLIWWISEKPTPQEARVDVVEPASNAIGTAGSMVRMFTRTLPGNVNLTIPVGSAEDRISTYLASGLGQASVTIDRIAFDTGSATLTPDSREQLDNLATILRAYPKATVTVSGHTDNAGSEASNVTLSRARAVAVADRLTAAGVTVDRVRTEGLGSSKPVADNSTAAGRAQNRRVTLDINGR
jgi:outer membrane protein OmpA-like peptidoglycan-associated protein